MQKQLLNGYKNCSQILLSTTKSNIKYSKLKIQASELLASQCIWLNQILSIKSLIRFATYHSNKYWEGINIASPGWFTILHRLQTIYIASQMTLWKLLIIIIRNLENNFVIVFVRYIQGGSSISPLNIHKRYLTSDNSVKEQLTCSSWFNISGPINWEISLPIYML